MYILVAWEDLGAAAEPEPSITLAVMLTSSSTREFLTSDNTQILTYLLPPRIVIR
jgi:hypothetical protein